MKSREYAAAGANSTSGWTWPAVQLFAPIGLTMTLETAPPYGLLDQLDGPVTGFLADGAYDGVSTRDLLRERYGETLDVVIPPPKNAVIRPQSARESNRSGSPYCPDPQQRPHGLAGGHRVQPAQPDRNADRPLEERDRPQAQISQLLQANHGDSGRPESSEHNDRTRTSRVRTHRLTLPLGKGRIPSPPRSMQTTLFRNFNWTNPTPKHKVFVPLLRRSPSSRLDWNDNRHWNL